MENLNLEIIKYYVDFEWSAMKIAKHFNKNVKTIWRVLKTNNIPSRTISQASMKYKCNDSFFNVIDTEEKAYWLGVLYADGNISKAASKSGQIFLTSADKEWVEDFLKAINSTNSAKKEIHKKFNKIIWKAQITSSIMFEALNNLGCTPKKSLTIRLPSLSPNLLHHFVRGYFDGDGTVGVYKNSSYNDWKILKSGFCSGSKEFIQDLLQILPIKNKTIKYSGVYITQHSLNDTINLYNYMYKDATVYLQRKKEKFDSYFETYKPRKRFNDYNSPSLMDEGIV